MWWLVVAVVAAVIVLSMVFLQRRSRTQSERGNPQVDGAFEDAKARARNFVDRDGPGGTLGPGGI